MTHVFEQLVALNPSNEFTFNNWEHGLDPGTPPRAPKTLISRKVPIRGIPRRKGTVRIPSRHSLWLRLRSVSDRLRSPNFRSLINENILGECFRNS